MVLTSASVKAGVHDKEIVLGKDVSTWRAIAQKLNEFLCLKTKSLSDVRLLLFTVGGTPRDRITILIEPKLENSSWNIELSIDNKNVWVSNIDPITLSQRNNWEKIGSFIEHLQEIENFLKEEVNV